VNIEGTQHIEDNYWNEGQSNSGPPCSPSSIRGGRHGRTKDLALRLSYLNAVRRGCAVVLM
jgi:hypothetical protein